MSEIIEVHGGCGKVLDFKVWKQGCSVKCPETEWSITRYPKPDELDIYFIVNDLCRDCETIDENRKRKK